MTPWDDGFSWGYTERSGVEARYVITRTADGQWKEVGQTSADGGKSWTTTIELLLSKMP